MKNNFYKLKKIAKSEK